MSGKPRTNMKRFWERVDMTGECWNWTGFKDRRGYGMLRFNGGKQLAHRLAFLFTFGTIPDGMFVLHKCDNPSCVNPKHLWLGTQQDNIEDAVRKGRISKASRNCGELCANSKLREEDIMMIRARYFLGEKQVDLAMEYEVDRSTISYAVTGRNWKGA